MCSQRKLFLECLLCCIVCDVGSCVLVLIVCLRFVCGDRLMCLPAGGSGRTLCPCCTGSPQERGFGGQSPPFFPLFSFNPLFSLLSVTLLGGNSYHRGGAKSMIFLQQGGSFAKLVLAHQVVAPPWPCFSTLAKPPWQLMALC